MSSVKPTDFPLLLQVFRDGLRYGVIATEEIIAWADGIIMAEDEPDYFFIEMALSGNELFSFLKQQAPHEDNRLPVRVLLGLAYQQVKSRIMDVKRLNTLLGDIIYRNVLTSAECNFLYQLYGDTELLLSTNREYLNDNEMKFLVFYKDFSLHNYEQWPEINNQVEETLNEEQEKNEMDYAANALRRQKKIVILGKWIYGFVYLLALASLLVIVTTYKPVGSHIVLSKFRSDLYQVATLYFYFFVGYWVLRGIYRVMGWVWG